MIKAVRDTIIVELEYADKISGIVVPDSAKQYHGDFKGKVVAVGPDYPYNDIKPGDYVFFNRHEGHRIYIKDKMYLSLRNKWVQAKKVK